VFTSNVELFVINTNVLPRAAKWMKLKNYYEMLIKKRYKILSRKICIDRKFLLTVL